MRIEEKQPVGKAVRLEGTHRKDPAGKVFQGPGEAVIFSLIIAHGKDIGGTLSVFKGKELFRREGGSYACRQDAVVTRPAVEKDDHVFFRSSGILCQRFRHEARAGIYLREYIPVLILLEGKHKKRKQPAPQEGEDGADQSDQHADAHELEKGTDHAAARRDRVGVSVADGRQRRERVPDGSSGTRDRGIGRC